MDINKILFLNIGWMKYYQGLDDESLDSIAGGGSEVDRKKWGHELYNFKPQKGHMYGFVEPISRRGKRGTIKLERIDEEAEDQPYLKNVLVIWLARDSKRRNTYIIGWYKNATIYRSEQEDLERYYYNEKIPYFIKAKKEHCILLPLGERTFKVPITYERGKGWVGRSNVWFADSLQGEVIQYKEEVLNYINRY